MLTAVLGVVAVTSYFAAAHQAATSRAPEPSLAAVHPRTIAFMILALALHAALLYDATVTANGVNLGVFNAASMIGWLMVALLLAISLRQRLENVAVVLMPLAACVLTLDLLFPSARIVPEHAAPGLVWHIALAMIAYSLVAIAAIQAAFIALAEYKLRHHHPILHFLPPLQTMEVLLFRIVAIAFVLLSISLAFGAVVIRDVSEQHLAHKIFFSVLAWIAFAILLWGRWRFGWRGTRAVRYVVGGSVLLALGYFGSKIVLELILRRV